GDGVVNHRRGNALGDWDIDKATARRSISTEPGRVAQGGDGSVHSRDELALSAGRPERLTAGVADGGHPAAGCVEREVARGTLAPGIRQPPRRYPDDIAGLCELSQQLPVRSLNRGIGDKGNAGNGPKCWRRIEGRAFAEERTDGLGVEGCSVLHIGAELAEQPGSVAGSDAVGSDVEALAGEQFHWARMILREHGA